MALKVWLPLNGSLENKGISSLKFNNNVSFSSNGKIGAQSLNSQLGWFSVPEMNGKKQMSFAYWVRLNTGTTTDWLDPFSWQSTDGTNTRRSRQEMYYYNKSGNVEAMTTGVWYANSGTSDASNSGLTQRAIGQWYHYAFTIDYSTGITQFFVDGALWKTTNNAATSFYIKEGNSFLLRESNLDCQINDFRLYDHCLSQKEVKEISQGLVLHYKLDNPYIETTTNLVNSDYGISSTTCFNGATGKYGYGTNTDMYLDIVSYQGKDCSRVRMGTNDLNAYPYVYFDAFAASGTTIHTLSFDYYPSILDKIIPYSYNGSYNWNYSVNGMSGSINNASSIILNVNTGQWNHIEITAVKTDTTNTSRGIGYIRLGAAAHTSNINNYWLFANVQVEAKDHATGYVGKGGTREIGYVCDSSGYNNNAIQNNIAINFDSFRYLLSAKFNGTDSYIKTVENNWMSQGAEALTVNLWVKATTWPTNGGRLVSCTESGGFNLEAGNSGYWRFPIYVYTNAEKTSRAYKYDSNEIQISALTPNDWNMITLVYDTTGTKTYINGELHHTYMNTSYGISFNTNARLFLGCEASAANPSSPYFNGNISDFRIYATALSAEDIADLYHTPANIDNLGNIHGFEFEEKQGNMLAVSPLTGSLTWDSMHNYYVITSQPSTSSWGIGPAVGVNPKKIIPWGYSYRLSYEVYSPVAATWNIDYNNNTVDATLSGNDNDTGRIVTQVAVPANQWTLITLGCSNTNSTKNPDHLPLYDYSTGLGPIMNNQSEPITWYMRNPQWYLVDTDESTNFQIYENGIFKTNFLKEDNMNNFASFRNNEKATWGVNLIEK